MHNHRRYIHPFQIILTPLVKELGIIFRPSIGIAYVTIIRNRHSEVVNKRLVSWNSVPRRKFRRRACVQVHRLSHRTLIFLHPAIGSASEAPFRNRHFDSVDTRSYLEISASASKFSSGSLRERDRKLPMRSNTTPFG
ncbi:hypothetical protein Taro_012534 [Colocasia esculenta]|uniref:Uncharacterized protein n=1 Tax=Colocasia esculenta TaxID=4460 RepID=A0A843U9C9_COLES|nr:hypothetical protein [Colocasia esculenta]